MCFDQIHLYKCENIRVLYKFKVYIHICIYICSFNLSVYIHCMWDKEKNRNSQYTISRTKFLNTCRIIAGSS